MMNDSIKNYRLESHTSPPLTLILTIILLVLFFVGFCTLYICRFFVEYLATSTMLLVRSPTTNMIQLTGSSGLDPSIVSLFPTFEYSSVKHLRQDKSVLECAVCLSEFEENDLLRLLTVCSHVFHRECIDLWLGSHTTCPVCRINLVPSQKSPEKSVGFIASQTTPQGAEAREGSCSITINQDEEEERKRIIERAGGAGENMAGGFGVIERPGAGEDMAEGVGGDTLSNLFMKSHSTGHSSTRIGENDDRFTLRVPEDFKEGITRRHNLTQSCITFGEFSNVVTDQEGDLSHPPRSSNGELAKV